jgi:hypothetical protein
MTYQFDSYLAEQYGVNEAIFMHNIFFWIRQNEANEKHLYIGRYWTYNTMQAFTELFPFWSFSQVRKIIKNLTDKGVLLVGNFNENTWNKTTWYSLSDDIVDFYKSSFNANKTAFVKNDKSKCEKEQIEVSNHTLRSVKSHTSYIGTDNKPYSKQQIEGALAFFEFNFPSEYERLMMQFKSQINDFVNFSQMFDATCEQEGLVYDLNVLSGRFKKYALAWIRNQGKFEGKVVEMVPNGPVKKINGSF